MFNNYFPLGYIPIFNALGPNKPNSGPGSFSGKNKREHGLKEVPRFEKWTFPNATAKKRIGAIRSKQKVHGTVLTNYRKVSLSKRGFLGVASEKRRSRTDTVSEQYESKRKGAFSNWRTELNFKIRNFTGGFGNGNNGITTEPLGGETSGDNKIRMLSDAAVCPASNSRSEDERKSQWS